MIDREFEDFKFEEGSKILDNTIPSPENKKILGSRELLPKRLKMKIVEKKSLTQRSFKRKSLKNSQNLIQIQVNPSSSH